MEVLHCYTINKWCPSLESLPHTTNVDLTWSDILAIPTGGFDHEDGDGVTCWSHGLELGSSAPPRRPSARNLWREDLSLRPSWWVSFPKALASQHQLVQRRALPRLHMGSKTFISAETQVAFDGGRSQAFTSGRGWEISNLDFFVFDVIGGV